jgi:hypothetical protein
MDSVPITLKKVVEAPPGVLTDEELLGKILAEVRAIKAQKGEVQPKAEEKTKTKPATKAVKAPVKKKAIKKKEAA